MNEWVLGATCIAPLLAGVVLFVFQTRGAARHERHVRQKGVPVFAWILQANASLLQPGTTDRGVQVLFTFDKTVPNLPEYLQALVKKAAALKGTKPTNPDEAEVARLVTDETYRPFVRAALPKSFTGGPEVYSAHVWVERKLLPTGALHRPYLYCVAIEAEPDSRVLMVPYPAGDQSPGERGA